MAADPLTRSTVDDLFNVDFSDFEDDPFADKRTTKDTRDDKAVLSPRAGLKRKLGDDDKENDGLGVDEEVKITKKRKPIAKLDEARLLSAPGIPKLRTISRSGQFSKKLRVKGKGHEFTDAARLLNHFQLWLDNLYPRAKFADALQLVEKAGHTKRMQIMRSEWINEGKPGYRKYDEVEADGVQPEEPDLFGTQNQRIGVENSINVAATSAQQSASVPDDFDEDALFIPDANRPSQMEMDNAPDDDELDALLAAQDTPVDSRSIFGKKRVEEESEGEDDLEELLATQAVQSKKPEVTRQPAFHNKAAVDEDEDEDELDALLAEQDAQNASAGSMNAPRPARAIENFTSHTVDDSSDDGDDLEALLALQRTKAKSTSDNLEPSLPTPQHTSSPARTPDSTPRDTRGESTAKIHPPIFSSSPIPNNPEHVDLDDLDALLASQEEKTSAIV